MILLIDNYDSFVHNLARYVRELGYETQVIRNDAITLEGIEHLKPTHLIFSPGPCTPDEAGVTLDAITHFAGRLPMLGVCLGHQAIGQAFGGKVVRAKTPSHGKSALIQHNGQGIFAGLPQPLRVGRYHSLAVSHDELPACLEVTASTDDGEIMALRHRDYPIVGVQFHPESILTDGGYEILSAFLSTFQ
jgi:anthranilate synthase/aminodeoxychorismate synthase-like glutamine amidotransferase